MRKSRQVRAERAGRRLRSCILVQARGRIDTPDLALESLGLLRLACAHAHAVRGPQLRDGFGRPSSLVQAPSEQLPRIGIVRDARELHQRVQRVIDLAERDLLVGVLVEVAAGVGVETLHRAEHAELAQQAELVRLISHCLVAQRDRVVVQAGVCVAVCRLFVITHRILRAPESYVEIADPVVERQLDLAFPLVACLEDLEVDLYGLLPFLSQLVLPSVVLELADRLHASCEVRPASVTNCNTRRDSSRCTDPDRNRSRSAAACQTSESGTMPMTSASSL